MTTVTGVIVKIDVANRKVDYDSILLSKSHGDELEWSCTEAVTVHFLDPDPSVPGYNGSPFMQGARSTCPRMAWSVPDQSARWLRFARDATARRQPITTTTSTRSWTATTK